MPTTAGPLAAFDSVTGVWYERGSACVKGGAGLGAELDTREIQRIAQFRQGPFLVVCPLSPPTVSIVVWSPLVG